MAFYDLSKEARAQLVQKIHAAILKDVQANNRSSLLKYFSNEDTYIRKSAYLSIGRIYKQEISSRKNILSLLKQTYSEKDFKIRQTTINAAGEIGMEDFQPIEHFFEKGLMDSHHSVRNAVIGSMKKVGQKNPTPLLAFARNYLHHEDTEVRREICHGIELRGRTHPQDILPLLEELQYDTKSRVRKTLVHVLGQIAYKKGCLETVIATLNHWKNKELVQEAIEEILDVHIRYADFSVKTYKEAKTYIDKHYK